MCVCVCVGGGGGREGGLRGTLANDCCANLITALMLISNVNRYIGKLANRLKNKATIRPKMTKTPFSQRPVANS